MRNSACNTFSATAYFRSKLDALECSEWVDDLFNFVYGFSLLLQLLTNWKEIL